MDARRWKLTIYPNAMGWSARIDFPVKQLGMFRSDDDEAVMVSKTLNGPTHTEVLVKAADFLVMLANQP